MTSDAKIQANRRNARKSTGPRTAAGKALAKYNALRHGILTATPLIPGEDVAAWDQHRQGVLDSLTPVGALETALADRVALTLWRLARLARAEALATSADIADALLPTPPSLLAVAHPQPDPLDMAIARAESDAAVQLFADAARRYAEFLDSLAGRPADEPVQQHVADAVLECARTALVNGYDLDASPPDVEGPEFLALLGVAGAKDWTAGRVRTGLALLAACGDEGPDWLVEVTAEGRRVAADKYDAQAAAATVRLAELRERKESAPARRAAVALLPAAGWADQFVRYEGHLQKVLMTTLHELERLQAARAGRDVHVPAVLDVTVSNDAAG